MKSIFGKIIFTVLLTSVGHAYELSPMEQEFESSGAKANRTFFLTNEGSESVAVELKAYQRVIGVDGKEQRIPTNDFFIYPQSLQIKAGQKRAVRVSWRGPANIDREKAYRLVADQVGVNYQAKTSSGANIQYKLKFAASMYVLPTKMVQSKIHVKSVKRSGSNLQLVLVNTGGKHQILKNVELIFKGKDGRSYIFKNHQLKSLEQVNLLAGGARVVSLRSPGHIASIKSAEVRFL